MVKDHKLNAKRLTNTQALLIFSNVINTTDSKESNPLSHRRRQEEELARSRVVCLKNMLVLENLKSNYDFKEVEDDVYEECR